MMRHVKRTVGPIAATVILALALTLALAGQAVGKTGAVNWICNVEGNDVTFVSAPLAARHGIERANSLAGVVFQKFGESCRVEVVD